MVGPSFLREPQPQLQTRKHFTKILSDSQIKIKDECSFFTFESLHDRPVLKKILPRNVPTKLFQKNDPTKMFQKNVPKNLNKMSQQKFAVRPTELTENSPNLRSAPRLAVGNRIP